MLHFSMKFLFSILILSSFRSTFSCLPSGKSNHVTIGSDTYVCVTLGPLNWNSTGEYLRLAVKIQADQLSSFKIPQSWTSTLYTNDTAMQKLSITEQSVPGTGLGVSVSSMGVLSYQRVYRQVLKVFLPTMAPTLRPTLAPSARPSLGPTAGPSVVPTTIAPSHVPSIEPSCLPTQTPTTATPSISFTPTEPPTVSPSVAPSLEPSFIPSATPTTTAPSAEPTTIKPTCEPTELPSVSPSTISPSEAPSIIPSIVPSATPSVLPSAAPTVVPTPLPTNSPSVAPSTEPTDSPVARRQLRSEFEEQAIVHGLDVVDNSTTNSTSNEIYGTTSVTFPMLMAIISVENGKVQSVVWDDFCNWCSSSRCVSNTVDYNNVDINGEGKNCYVHDDSCVLSTQPIAGTNLTSSSTNLCELNVYVTWHGTDSSGAHFQSAASRFSRMDSFQMKNFTGSLQDERATY